MTDLEIKEIAFKILNQNAFNETIYTASQWQNCFNDIVKVLKGELK